MRRGRRNPPRSQLWRRQRPAWLPYRTSRWRPGGLPGCRFARIRSSRAPCSQLPGLAPAPSLDPGLARFVVPVRLQGGPARLATLRTPGDGERYPAGTQPPSTWITWPLM